MSGASFLSSAASLQVMTMLPIVDSAVFFNAFGVRTYAVFIFIPFFKHKSVPLQMVFCLLFHITASWGVLACPWMVAGLLEEFLAVVLPWGPKGSGCRRRVAIAVSPTHYPPNTHTHTTQALKGVGGVNRRRTVTDTLGLSLMCFFLKRQDKHNI